MALNVLHVFKTYLPDSFTGVERVIWEIAEGMAGHGVQTRVMSLSANTAPSMVPVDRHESHRANLDLHVASTGLSLSAFGMFRRLTLQADLVHYHFPWPMMDLLHLLLPPQRPTVVTYHSDVVRQKRLLQLYAPVRDRFLGSVDRIVATSPNYLRSSPVLERFASKATVIPIGIQEAQHVPDVEVELWQKRVGPRFMLFVGALRYYKGLPFLLEAARTTGLPVVIAGAGELEQEIKSANLPNVKLVGEISESAKEALLSRCAGFVFPSHLRSEAFGVALLEAARAGRPMISCEMGTGTSFVNIDGRTGWTVPPGDSLALAEAMLKLWNNPIQAEVLGRGARQRYESLFTAPAMADAYRDLYIELLSKTDRKG